MSAPTPAHSARISRRVASLLHLALLAVLAYVPSLLAARGKVPTDTKLYLYLNPGRLMSDATSAWDPRQFAGSVPHQTVSYLWPSGPWYWSFDKLGVPDWVAHRLWIGTVLVLAGLGARWAAKQLGLGAAAALTVGVVYQLSPYVLPYISRTSTMLLPWAGLGWMVALTVRATTQTRWRDVALFGLVMFTVGSTNATATLMIAPAPALWLLHAASSRLITWRTALRTAAKIGLVSALISASWIAMVSTQSAYGANVLGYTETLEAVSQTATSPEVLRGLGYWLFYVHDPSGYTTSAAFRYMSSGQLVVTGYALLIGALLGLALVRWAYRRYAFWLMLVGAVLGVGVHPINRPSPLMALLTRDTRSSLSLALRSSSRAAPLLLFGMALGIASLTQAVIDRPASSGTRLATIRARTQRLLPALVCLVAVMNLPALWHGEFVDANLVHDQSPPQAWLDGAAALDAQPAGYRVMQLPASESAAYRWGYTVDPPLPGLTTRPEMVRDWTPLGSAGAMDLLYAFDDRFQDGTAESAAIAPIARLLGVDTIWLANDIAFERFRSARPEPTAAVVSAAPGIGTTTTFGPAEPNVPYLAMLDEQQIDDPTIGVPSAPVALVPVEDPQAIARVKNEEVVLSGSGDGVVDAAAAGLLDGSELIRYSADSTTAATEATHLIVTDSNRDRAHQWRGAQDVWGFTEDGGPGAGVTRFDSADQRLPVFSDPSAATMTIAQQRGGVAATASAYGELLAYRPEDRAANAVDGHLDTAWVVGDHAIPEGESLHLEFVTPVSDITLVQPQDLRNRWIATIDVAVPGRTERVSLTDASRTTSGQRVHLPAAATSVTLKIRTTSLGAVTPGLGLSGVGFAEVRSESGTAEEVTRVPQDGLDTVGTDATLDIVLTRLRTRPTNRYRADPEPWMARAFTLAAAREFTPTVTARLAPRADDTTLATLFGWTGTTATARLLGAPRFGGWAATDGDASTAWVSPFSTAVGSSLTIPVTAGQPLASLVLTQPNSGDYARITEITVASGGQTRSATVGEPDGDGHATVTFPSLTTGPTLTLTINATSNATTVDRRYGEVVSLPVAISEVSGDGIVGATLPARLDTGCRTDLVTVDDQPLPVRISGDTAALLAGSEATVAVCGPMLNLSEGEHIVRTTPGMGTGLDIDRIVLHSNASTPTGAQRPSVPQPSATMTSPSADTRRITVGPCAAQCWLVFGEGYNRGWSATLDSKPLPPPTQVDGGFNGWRLQPSRAQRTVVVTWTPQTKLDRGLLITAVTVLACLGGVFADRRRRPPVLARSPRLATAAASVSRRRGFDIAVSAGATGALCVSLRAGLAIGVVAAVCAIVLRRPRAAALVGAATLAVVAFIIARKVAAEHPEPGFGWPANWEWLHQVGIGALILAGAACGFGWRVADDSIDGSVTPPVDGRWRQRDDAGGPLPTGAQS